jgi:hypothetical protein
MLTSWFGPPCSTVLALVIGLAQTITRGGARHDK